MAALTLVLGGVRSGKSRWAEQLAADCPPVTYLATAQAGDAEMVQRIAVHRARRAAQAPPWRTVEEPLDIAAVVAAHEAGSLLLEDLGLWITNLLVRECTDGEVRGAVERLLTAVEGCPGRVVVVSPEVGLGIVPANALARRFGDLVGEANQRLAAAAEEVYWCVAGIPVPIKGDKTHGRGDSDGMREKG